MKSIALIVFCVLCCTTLAWPSVTVPAQFPNIQTAINAAKEGDSVFVADGIYTGEGNRDLDFNGKNIVLKSESGPEFTTIDCEGTEQEPHSAFQLDSGEDTTAVIQGFTLTGAYGLVWDDAAVKCDGAYPTLKECIITGNNCGGVRYSGFALESHFRMYDCVVTNNAGNGVTAFVTGATLTNCELSHNGLDGVHLSAQWYGFDFDMFSCLVDGNGDVGVFMMMGSALLHVKNCTIVNNRIGLQYEWDFPKLNSESTALAVVDTSTLENNILAFNSEYGMISQIWAGPVIVRCNNAYGNLIADYYNVGVGPGYEYDNISDDPLFCDTITLNYTLEDASPCAPANNVCGVLMGKFEVACGSTAISDEPEVTLPRKFALHQNYPNPFNPTTQIALELPVAARVRLEVFNLLGQKISTLIDADLDAGYHHVYWDARGQASGLYFYRVQTKDFEQSRAMVLLK